MRDDAGPVGGDQDAELVDGGEAAVGVGVVTCAVFSRELVVGVVVAVFGVVGVPVRQLAGLGGVGGSHLLTLTRLGIGAFTVSDFDTFEIANFNRQAGASLSNLNRKKTDALLEQALDINPELDVNVFPDGVHDHNASEFLAEADLYLDGLDYFARQARRTRC